MAPQASLVAGIGDQSQSPAGSNGYQIGSAASNLVGFYGVTPVAQGATGGSAVTTTAATTSSPWGFATSTQANAVVTLVNGLQSTLVALGLISS